MLKLVAFTLMAVMLLSLVGCADPRWINNVEYDTYGLINQNEKQNPDIQYEVSWGNVIWGFVLSETIVAPIYFFGYALYEPVGPKSAIKGQLIR